MKKYQVFISSTYNDLIEERIAVRDAVLMLRQFPVGMEQFTASDDDQWKVIQRSIDCSDYWVFYTRTPNSSKASKNSECQTHINPKSEIEHYLPPSEFLL